MQKEIFGVIGAFLIIGAIIVTTVTGSSQKGGEFFMTGVSVVAKPFTWSIQRAGAKLQERLSVMTNPVTK